MAASAKALIDSQMPIRPFAAKRNKTATSRLQKGAGLASFILKSWLFRISLVMKVPKDSPTESYLPFSALLFRLHQVGIDLVDTLRNQFKRFFERLDIL